MANKKILNRCEYLKTQNGFTSGCGIRAAYNKRWIYCPYCGKRLMIINRKSSEGFV